jgi:hypothetical protein
MPEPASVCIVGNVQEHLNARAAVLQHFWRVETVALEASEHPKFESDLVVICSSIPWVERQWWVDQARAKAPAILIVRVDEYDSGPSSGADATVDREHGPGALVSAIYELLTERGLPSRAWPESRDEGWLQ